ncbi:hypothetical protein IQ246_15030 [aff. Roholtiella sp. LEGE 12411]|nr:hypothetical protein [aff. Roholtiella sp. LEGE 12411]
MTISDATWLTNLRVPIWEYLPPVENYTNNLIFKLGDDIERVEGKLDQLLN